MDFEVAGHRVTQCHSCAEHDQDCVKAAAQMLKNIANASPEPSHIQAGYAEADSRQHVDSPVPAMKDGKAVADTGNELQGSREHDENGRTNMHDHGEIAHGIARDVTTTYIATPPVDISSQRRNTIKRGYREREHQLANDGHAKPKPRGCFQGAVRNGTQVQPVGP